MQGNSRNKNGQDSTLDMFCQQDQALGVDLLSKFVLVLRFSNCFVKSILTEQENILRTFEKICNFL